MQRFLLFLLVLLTQNALAANLVTDMERRDRHHTMVGIAQMRSRLLRLNIPRVLQQDTRDDLKTIGNPMLKL